MQVLAGKYKRSAAVLTGTVLTDEEIRELRDGCSRFVHGHGPTRPGDLLAAIPADVEPDRYGEGGVVAELEREVAAVLGKPAAVFVPSGTMAQQVTLRVHADRRGRRTVLFHEMCHLRQHEDGALERVQGLVGRPVGDATRLITLADLQAVAEPVAALLLELPQRDLGGQQPPLDDLDAQLAWAREHGAATHLDGARLWESAAGYGVAPTEVARRFDTVYVSFYKGIGALPGCCVAGADDLVAEVREWRRRMGGTLFGLWPNAATALTLLRRRLPAMPAYLEHARAVAAALAAVDGVAVVPDPPQTPMLHLLLRTTPDAFEAGVRRLAQEQKLWAWPKAMSTGDPAVMQVELSVGEATCELSADEVRDAVALLLGP